MKKLFLLALAIGLISLSCQQQQGPAGPQGPPGVSLVSTSVLATATQCPSGGNVLLVAQDTDGTGTWEPDDANQTAVVACNGTPGTSVSTVQLCSGGGQTTYPSNFPEFGLCVSNILYGVYWNGSNAWLAEIVPGTYSSTSSTTPCTFTVTSGCNIQ